MPNVVIKDIVEEDFINYKKASMFIAFPNCSWKCERECGRAICQNSALANTPSRNIGVKTILNKYLNNPITEAIVVGGLEPFDSLEDLEILITYFRAATKDDFVIYTGYTEEEVANMIPEYLLKMENIIIKYGRFIPDQESHYDETLGVELSSLNQYAKRY